MEELTTIVLTTVLAFIVTKLCQFVWDKLHSNTKSKRRNK